jgi:dihydrolipoamide dehydrogenase
MHSELVVLGGGPGGYAAAFLAADLGMNVSLIDIEPRLGGTCLLRGCIPSKALLHATELIEAVEHAGEWGLDYPPPKIHHETLRARKDKVVETLTGGLDQLASKRKVRRIVARGVFVDSTTLQLEDGEESTWPDSPRVTFDHCILATGSEPTVPGFLRLPSDRVMNSSGTLALPDVPEKLLVIGGGYIGLEMGTVYSRLGSEVTVVEMLDRLLPAADADLVRPLAKRLASRFAAIHTSTKVASVEDRGERIAATLQGEAEGEFEFDRVLVSIGRSPRSDGFGLENTNVRTDERGFVQVDSQQRTDDDRIFAIGDVAGEPMLAHAASYEGKVAVETLAGGHAENDWRACPAVVFTDPEIAWAGPTENEAQARGLELDVVKYPWSASGRAHAIGRSEGLTKLLIEPNTERIVGAGIVGCGAGELIAEAALAIELGATAGDLAGTIHAHPTLAETLHFAAESFYGTATEIYRPKKPS